MHFNQANQLLPVPTNPLKIPTAPTVASTSATTGEPPIYFSLIIPTYNECQNIKTIVEKLSQLLDGSIAGDYEMIVVDDNSPDRTWEVALSLTPDYPQLRVMRREHERGLSTAVIRGWQAARGEVLGVIDADLQHPPETLLNLLAEIKRGADLVAASRHVAEGGVSDWSMIRRFLSRGAQTLGLVILPGVVGRVSDPMSGYFMVRRSCIAGKTLNPAGYKILIEVLGRGDIRWIGEVGYVFQERLEGESKVTWKQYIEYLRHLLRLRFARWPMGKFIRFGLVGFSGVFVNMGVLYVLRNFCKLELTRSLILAAELAIISNFLWNDIWTFGEISRRQRGNRKRLKRLLKFNTICLMGLILNVLLVNVMFNIFGMNEYLANLIAILAVTLWNFWINMKLSWRVTDVN
ncbi:MAG: glycosyltransferase family 2 protein [Oscillatoriales cyanobacterium]|uniref:Glycosyltransferase family 2 protein n=1 Tax=Microcoleus anatoxicus PTRS2 TaxID=2705321 RepID=A0ABU8YMM2_9CYAN|nr:MAG: glycosyltransferase family 2 protein [Oscillatoriales cyanobacterium]TAE01378.1 MAG: glycosyltransferase family 2 protein [Oscillatoriales cyanobacterium]TAE99551.1 MAG: glycosyltransferase family 2 protein [Oscillatoriales cyanobacterium]TAF37029.1 MAG: glycosyltransferase family 2 protein [Oscillatoriales cyanobacterium]TAF62719.1 MAG: glycosyltransferase family 2 protein [Oscillatoriales cyanobacterium]